MNQIQTHVSKEKKRIIQDLINLIDSKKTVMITSIKGLPTKQFQKIKKNLEKEVEIRVVKKRALIRAIESSKKENIKELEKFVREDIAILISNLDAFELSAKLAEEKSPVKAKAGQEAPEDIKIEAGPTDLPAGPAVSELGSLGLTVKVIGGKIEILENRVIIKKGEKIKDAPAGVMGKLGIMPFSVGFIPLVAYDSNVRKIFKNLNVNKEETTKDLKQIFSKSKIFAVNLGYICKETLGLILAKAGNHEKAIILLINKNEERKEKDNINQNPEEDK